MIALHAGTHPGSLWLAWSADPVVLIGIALGGVLYARGIWSLGGRRRFHGTWRPTVFYLGLFTAFVALISPLDRLADELFVAHMAQHVLLTMVAVPLFLLGAPVIPVLRGIPRRVRRKVVIPFLKSSLVRSILGTLARPLLAWLLFVTVFLGWHLSAAFEAAVTNQGLHLLEHLLLAGVSYLFWWNVIDPLPLRPNLSYLVRIPYIFIIEVPFFVLGAFLTFATNAWYPLYAASAPRYGLTGLEDQQLGGVTMWIPGSFIIGAAVVINLVYVVRSEQAQQLAREVRAGQGGPQ